MDKMKAVGLVTEYNPFHNGHVFHLNKSLELSGADVAVAVMSGNFVQRGEPAVIDKYSRCAAAVNSGVNLVIELPSYYALSSAEGFAAGAVKTLAAVGADFIAFGSECGDIEALREAAEILTDEPEEYKALLKKYNSCGLSFPSARYEALKDLLSENNKFAEILKTPNNILGIEYLKEIIRKGHKITPITFSRHIAGFNDTDFRGSFASASAIRLALEKGFKKSFEKAAEKSSEKGSEIPNASELKSVLPESMYRVISENSGISCPVFADDFSSLLNYKLSQLFYLNGYEKARVCEALCSYCDVSYDLANRIFSSFTGKESFSALVSEIKTRGYTYSRVSRCLMHILLEIKTSDAYKYADAPYIRVLGFDKKGQAYLHQIKKTCPVPVITKTADYRELLSQDVCCTDVYNQILLQKFGTPAKDEFRRGAFIKEQNQTKG